MEKKPTYDTSPTILAGDALALIPTLEDASVQLAVTSPEYPGQYGNRMSPAAWMEWTDAWMTALTPKMTPNGVLALNIQFKRTADGWFDRRVFDAAWPPARLGWNLLDVYIYGKTNPPPNGALTYCDPPGWEFVFILTRAGSKDDVLFNPVRRPYARKSIQRSGKLYSNMSTRDTDPHPDGARQSTLMLLSMSGDQKRPRAKGISFPRGLPERFVRQYTNPGDLVLDPFCGVGTAVWVAAWLGRRAVGFEIDAEEAERGRAWLAELADRPAVEGLKIEAHPGICRDEE